MRENIIPAAYHSLSEDLPPRLLVVIKIFQISIFTLLIRTLIGLTLHIEKMLSFIGAVCV